MLTTFQEVDMSNLMKLRSDHKDEFEKAHGVRLGFMSGFVKAATSALKKFVSSPGHSTLIRRPHPPALDAAWRG